MLGGIRAHAQRQPTYDDIAYWAPADSKTEVDFVLTLDGAALPIEVKAATRYNNTMLKGLRPIADLSGISRRILIYKGRRSFQTEDGIQIWPLDHFHQALNRGCL